MSIASPYQPTQPKQAIKPLWLCLRFSLLPLNVIGVRFSDPEAAAVYQQRSILHSNKLAQSAMVKTGQSVERALMLEPNLQLIERNKRQEAQTLESLCDWAYRFTSHVHTYNEHTLLLEIGRSLKLFNGLKHLEHLIRQELDNMALDTQFGIANTPKAAHLLSHGEQSAWAVSLSNNTLALENSPLMHLAIDEKVLVKLQHCGFKHLGQLLAIPNKELGQRFGQKLIQYLDQVQGKQADPLLHITPAENFISHVHFSEPISNRHWIDQQVERLLKSLVYFIQQRNVVCRTFTWRFYSHNSHLIKSVEVSVRSAQCDFDTFAMLTELQFENLNMNWEFSSIELSSDSLFQKKHDEADLFEVNRHSENINQLLDKLASRLGHDALYKVSAKPEHLPELISRRCSVDAPFTNKRPEKFDKKIEHSDFKSDPLWLLEHPKQLQQNANGPIHQGALNLIHGPHRVTSHWWQNLHSRDYYIARQTNGRLLWVYLDRSQACWYLHGVFA